MSKRRIKKQLYYISALTLVVALIWLGIRIYQVWQKTPEPVVPQAYLQPLVPRVNRDVLEKLKERKYFTDEDLSVFSVLRSVGEEEIIIIEESEGEESTAAGSVEAPLELIGGEESTNEGESGQ